MIYFRYINDILYMNKTMLHIRLDKALKNEVQKVADELGLSITAVGRRLFSNFAVTKSIVFDKPLIPNTKTACEIDESLANHKAGKNASSFNTPLEMDAHFDKLRA